MSFDNFLKDLETEGGKMLVIVCLLVFIIGTTVAMVLSGHPPQEVGRELATSAVSSLLGILYGYLKANGPK